MTPPMVSSTPKVVTLLGLEPGNCIPDGRDVVRKNGELTVLAPQESVSFTTTLTFTDNESDVTSL